jgi:hypothetical protein
MARLLPWLALASCLVFDAALRQAEVLSYPDLARPLGPFDPDNWLYLTQVRQWLEGGWAGFFNHRVAHTDAPFGNVYSHWTRPMQALLALFYALMPGSLPENTRLMLSATWLPPCLALAAAWLMALAARRRFDHGAAFAGACLLMLLTPYREVYFAPGASDHHGLLSMLWCGVLALLLDRNPAGRPRHVREFALGAVLGLMVWVSLEALVLTALVYALLALEGVFFPERITRLARVALGASAVVTLGVFIEWPAHDILPHPPYDTLSVVHAALLWLCAAAAGLLAILFPRLRGSFAPRFFAGSCAGAASLLAMYLLYPKFFAGALVDANPFVFTGFLPYVGELQHLLALPPRHVADIAAEPALATLLVFALLLFKKGRQEVKDLRDSARRRQLITWLVLLVALFDLTLTETRWTYYLQPTAIAALAALLPGLLRLWARRLKLSSVLWLFFWARWRVAVAPALIILAYIFRPATPEAATDAYNCLQQIRYVVQTQQLQPLLGESNLVLLTKSDAGADVQFFTPYRVIASNFHREGQGLADLQKLSQRVTADAARPLLQLREVSALLVCPDWSQPDSWLNALDGETHSGMTMMGGSYTARRPPWITPVEGLRFMNISGPHPGLYKVAREAE